MAVGLLQSYYMHVFIFTIDFHTSLVLLVRFFKLNFPPFLGICVQDESSFIFMFFSHKIFGPIFKIFVHNYMMSFLFFYLVPEGGVVKCRVSRNRKGVDKGNT